jgi:hypothetical protein
MQKMTKATRKRCPIWGRYINEPTDRKRDQIERALSNAGARFAIHSVPDGLEAKALTDMGSAALPSVVFSDIDWIEDDDGIWIEAYVLADKAERAVSELRGCGFIAGVGEADWNGGAA